MIISGTDQTTYKKFTKYVRYSLPTIANIPSMRSAFKKYAQMDRATLQRALCWGNKPTLWIGPLPSTADSFLNGRFFPNTGSNTLEINELLVKAFENGTPNDLLYAFNSAGKSMPRVGVTILHELVHWGDDQDGIDYKDDDGDEEGELFEQAVYGRNTEG